MKKLKKLLNKHKNIFIVKDFKYLNEADYNTSSFYWLPKIHKCQLITNAIKEQNSEDVSINEPLDLKVRPIVRGPKCPTRKLSELIDASLKPFLKHVKSYIRNSKGFLNKCDRTTDRNSYCNFWRSRPIHKHPRFNIPFILVSVDFILKSNTCVFDNEYFLQLQGTAMGTVFVPTYANLSMGCHKIKLYDLIEFNYNLDIRQYFVKNWIPRWLWNTFKDIKRMTC